MRRLLALLAAATTTIATALVVSVGTAPEAAAWTTGAWTNGACPTASGVTVVIDFQELGGGIHTRCAPGPVTSGFDALKQAGIEYQTTIRFPGFLCKIAGKPSTDPCVDTSPATAFWSYWVAPRGGTWCYSNWGAGSRTPPAGSVEGWSFSYNKAASTSPPPGVAPPPQISGMTPSPLAANDCDHRASAPKATTTSPPTTKPSGISTATPHAPTVPGTTPKSSVSAGSSGGRGGAEQSGGSGSTIAGANSPDGANPTDGSANGQENSRTNAAATDKTDAEVLAENESSDDHGSGVPSEESKSGERYDSSSAGGKDDERRETAAVKAEKVDLGGVGDNGSAVGVFVALALVLGIGSVALLRRRHGRSV